jgi:hypothetical protein
MTINLYRDATPTLQADPMADDDLPLHLYSLKQALIYSASDTVDMRHHPSNIKKLRDALVQLEQKSQNHGRFFAYTANHGRHERMLEAGTIQHEIDQLFSHLEHLENAHRH